jgi:hypothetical protein
MKIFNLQSRCASGRSQNFQKNCRIKGGCNKHIVHFRSIVTSVSPTFFDSSEIWHNEIFMQNIDNYILVKPKSLPQKNYRFTNFSIFHDFPIILTLITQRFFIAET